MRARPASSPPRKALAEEKTGTDSLWRPRIERGDAPASASGPNPLSGGASTLGDVDSALSIASLSRRLTSLIGLSFLVLIWVAPATANSLFLSYTRDKAAAITKQLNDTVLRTYREQAP